MTVILFHTYARHVSFAELYPVHLQLLAWRRLEPHDRIGRHFGFERAHKCSQLARFTLVAGLGNLSHQHLRRSLRRLGRFLAPAQMNTMLDAAIGRVASSNERPVVHF